MIPLGHPALLTNDMYRFVDTLGPEAGTVPSTPHDLPVPCLAEDAHGDRLILLPTIDHEISQGYADRAADHGASYVAAPDGQGWVAHLIGGDPLSFDEPPTRSALRSRSTVPAETFVHLHTHSTYSSLDGYGTIEEMVDVVVAHGQKALGIADHGLVSAHPELYNRCVDAGISPVLGIEAYLQEDRHRRTRTWWVKVDQATGAEYEVDTTDYDDARIKAEGLERRSDSAEARWGYQHITLWAMNDVGLRNLWALSTVSFREGLFDGKPRVDYEVLERFSEGVIASTGCLRGPLARAVLDGDEQALLRDVGRLMEIYPDRLYVEIHTNTLEDQRKVNLRAVQVARDYGLPMIGAVDAHYPRAQDAPMHQAWLAMTTSKDGNSESGMFTGDGDYYLMSEAEVREALAYLGQDVVDECVDNTAALAARCDAKVTGESHPPVYSRPSTEHPDPVKRDAERLVEKCMEGWWKVEAKIEAGVYTREVAEDRLDMEVDLLVRRQFPGYFLLVEDYVTWVREKLQGLVGPGRGSGSGSLVAYLLGITGIDPIEHGLIFERFINEGRKGLPDFDCVSGKTEFHRDGPGGRTVEELYVALHGRPDAPPGECEACGTPMSAIKKGYKGNPPSWRCVPCYKKRHHLRTKGLPSILGRNVLGRLSNQPLHDVLYKGVRDTVRVTVLDGRHIESTPDHRHLTISGWKEAGSLRPGELLVLMDDNGRRASHTDNLSHAVRRRLVERAGASCESCLAPAPEGSWLGKFEVAHLDYSTKNIDNMLLLCVPCHRRMDAHLGTPTVIRPVVRVEDAGLQPVYDMVMEHEDHSWVGNGFVTHNCDFQTNHREPIKEYLVSRWGEDYTLSIGTNLTVKPKKAADKALSILRGMGDVKVPEWSDVTAFKAAVEESGAAAAGTEVSWEEFSTDHEELVARLNSEYPEFMALVEGFVGRIYSYGKHAAGMVVSTDKPLTDLPMRVDDKGRLISQFDMNALEALGHVKFDILTIRNLDTIKATIDRIREETGVQIDPERWVEEYEDPQVWAEIAAGNTLGMFQIETSAGTRVAKAVAPENIAELAAAVSLNRPGPLRSGVTDSYLRRKHGQEPVTAIDDRLTTALADTFAVPIYQEQIMTICREIAGYSLPEADDVRRILGKKKRDLVDAEGRRFIPAAVERGMSRRDAERLWEQITEYAKYVFNLSHAAGYALIAHWTAWLKVHYPRQFIPAILSGIKDERVPELIADARRMGYAVAGPDINESDVAFSTKAVTVRYGLANVPGIGEATAQQIVKGQPYASVEDFRERMLVTGSAVNAGHLRALAYIGAFDSVHPHRRALVTQLEAEASGAADRCIFKDESVLGPNGLPCTFDWDNEPDPPMLSKGRGKNKVSYPKPPPKRCTRACLAGETLVVTRGGLRPISELAGGAHHLLVPTISSGSSLPTWFGQWQECRVESFGQQRLARIVMTRNRHEKVIYATADHEWFVRVGRGTNRSTIVRQTHELSSGDTLKSVRARAAISSQEVPVAVMHGFVFGDGTRARSDGSAATLDIHDAATGKQEAMLPLFFGHRWTRNGRDDAIRVLGLPRQWKDLPDLGLPPSYLVSWLSGYVAADGTVGERGVVKLSSADRGNLEYVRSLCSVVGISTGKITVTTRVGFGVEESALHEMSLRRTDLPEWFFRNRHHRERFDSFSGRERPDAGRDWTVVSVEETDRYEEVYCAVVPGAEAFALSDDLLTHNCRNFTPPPPVDPDDVQPYGEADIRAIEYEVLGTYVSSTPFDRIDPEVREELDTPATINSGKINREYTMAAVVESVRTKDDRTGRRMAFVTLSGEGGNLDAVVFGSIYPDVKKHLEVGRLVFVALYKTDRGVQVQEIYAP